MNEANHYYKQAVDPDTEISGMQRLAPLPKFAACGPRRQMDGEKFIELLELNFSRIALKGDGITKRAVVTALGNPSQFSIEEYVMLEEMNKYFETIAGLVPPPQSEPQLITKTHLKVLKQFLVFCRFNLEQFHDWLNRRVDFAPPPLVSA